MRSNRSWARRGALVLFAAFLAGFTVTALAFADEPVSTQPVVNNTPKLDFTIGKVEDNHVGMAVVHFPKLPARHLYSTDVLEVDGVKAVWKAKYGESKPYVDMMPATHRDFIDAGECKSGAIYCIFYCKPKKQ